jgi:vitamin B12 transporter
MLGAQTPAADSKASTLPTRTETITVVAEPVPAETLAGTYTQTDREAIHQTGARNLAELLRLVSLVHLSQAGGKGSLTTVSLRSAKPNFTLVLLNSVPVNDIGDLLGGAFNFATIATEDIDRVEILRGPLSSVYGSEAVGGVISIILRPPWERAPLRFSVEGGNYGDALASAGTSLQFGKVSGSLDGSFARMGEQVLDDGFQLGTVAAQGAVDVGKGKHADSFVYWNRLSSTGFPVSSGGPEYALSRQVETD